MRVVVVIPAGRKRFLELLVPQLLAQEDSFDELRLWVNTGVQEDIDYMMTLNHPKLRLDYRASVVESKRHIGASSVGELSYVPSIQVFMNGCVESNTIYIRVDDDIIWLDKDFIKTMVDYRLESSAFLVSANVVNNGVTNAIHKEAGVISIKPVLNKICMCLPSLMDEKVFFSVHDQFLQKYSDGKIDDYKLDGMFSFKQRISVNCISWFGKDLLKADFVISENEEEEMSNTIPKKLNSCFEVSMKSLCVHYAFNRQKDRLDDNGYFDKYKEILK